MTDKHNQPLPVGFSDFRELREYGCYYVDKSLFIKQITQAAAKVLLIPRPRRFGKTLNLSMLRYFYEKSDEDRIPLFDGLTVRDDDVFKTHFGKYPVIWMTFKDVKNPEWSDCFRNLQDVIYKEYTRHRGLLDSNLLFPEEITYFRNILEGKAGLTDYQTSLEKLSAFLRRIHNKRVIILIDEYDTPIHAGYSGGFYEQVISFMRNLLSGGLKDNEHLFKGVITGILRVAKESVFSGLNNLGVYTLLSPRFSDSFGFTEPEVRKLLDDFKMNQLYDEISFWYNGYVFGNTVLYNPWSVLNFLDNQGDPMPYWINTADTGMIENLATRGGRELREELGLLLEGRDVTRPVYESIVMKDLEKRDDLLWSFLLFSGYLKPVEKIDYETWKLCIPNYEVYHVYRSLVRNWFAEKIEHNKLEQMLNALENGDAALFEHILQEIVVQVMSYHDFSGVPEKVYHALVLGMLVWLSGRYEIRSNRESGYGRYDLMLKPKNIAKQGIVIEFKKVYEDEKPEDVLEDALNQIRDRKYAAELEAAGVKDILKLAVAFQGKKLWVKQDQTSVM
ncbi:MAG: AAA family ATPase [Desulfobacteraceae bacterium]|nr:AAA family ATPase [Desulfobacteraceae bacterium]